MAENQKKKLPRGRPQKNLTEEQYGMVRKYAKLALTQEEISMLLDISPDTFTRIKKRDDRFLQEYKKGRAEAKASCVTRLWNLVKAEEPSAIYFYLKTQCGWSERPKDDAKESGETANQMLEMAKILKDAYSK